MSIQKFNSSVPLVSKDTLSEERRPAKIPKHIFRLQQKFSYRLEQQSESTSKRSKGSITDQLMEENTSLKVELAKLKELNSILRDKSPQMESKEGKSSMEGVELGQGLENQPKPENNVQHAKDEIHIQESRCEDEDAYIDEMKKLECGDFYLEIDPFGFGTILYCFKQGQEIKTIEYDEKADEYDTIEQTKWQDIQAKIKEVSYKKIKVRYVKNEVRIPKGQHRNEDVYIDEMKKLEDQNCYIKVDPFRFGTSLYCFKTKGQKNIEAIEYDKNADMYDTTEQTNWKNIETKIHDASYKKIKVRFD